MSTILTGEVDERQGKGSVFNSGTMGQPVGRDIRYQTEILQLTVMMVGHSMNSEDGNGLDTPWVRNTWGCRQCQ